MNKEKTMSVIIGGDAARLAGLQIDALQKFKVGQLSLNHLERFLNLSPEAREERFGDGKKKTHTNLLEPLGSVTIPATSGAFVAKDKFVVNTDPNAEVMFCEIGGNFNNWFLSGKGKIEDPISEQILRYAKLRKASVDGHIIEELSGEKKAETTLTELWYLLKQQRSSESGPLLTNGWANIFYVRDITGVLRAVGAHWPGDGWYVSAGLVASPSEGGAGYQVFFRNVLEPSVT